MLKTSSHYCKSLKISVEILDDPSKTLNYFLLHENYWEKPLLITVRNQRTRKVRNKCCPSEFISSEIFTL